MDYDTWKTGGAYAGDCSDCGARLTDLDAYHGCERCAEWEHMAWLAARQFFADVWLADGTDYWGRTPGQDDPADLFDAFADDELEVPASMMRQADTPRECAADWFGRRQCWMATDAARVEDLAETGRAIWFGPGRVDA